MVYTPEAPQLGVQPASEELKQQIEQHGAPWLDQFNQHLLLTVQAFQRLHQALDGKFTRKSG